MLHDWITPVDQGRDDLLVPEEKASIASIGIEDKAQANVVALALSAINAWRTRATHTPRSGTSCAAQKKPEHVPVFLRGEEHMQRPMRDHGAYIGVVCWLQRAERYRDPEPLPGQHTPGAPGSNRAL
jgi:hypothetical protein